MLYRSNLQNLASNQCDIFDIVVGRPDAAEEGAHLGDRQLLHRREDRHRFSRPPVLVDGVVNDIDGFGVPVGDRLTRIAALQEGAPLLVLRTVNGDQRVLATELFLDESPRATHREAFATVFAAHERRGLRPASTVYVW